MRLTCDACAYARVAHPLLLTVFLCTFQCKDLEILPDDVAAVLGINHPADIITEEGVGLEEICVFMEGRGGAKEQTGKKSQWQRSGKPCKKRNEATI